MPGPAERAYYRGVRLLEKERGPEAAAEFQRALDLDPGLEGAWHGLLAADPTPALCRRVAQNCPGLFDPYQPLQDRELLVRGPGWSAQAWRESLIRYEEAVLAAESDDADILRSDLLGRKAVAEACRDMRGIRADIQILLIKKRLPPASLRSLETYDFARSQEMLVGSIALFDAPSAWLEYFRRLDAAGRAFATGMAQLKQAAELDPTFLPTQLTLAYVDLARGDTAAALERCRRLLAEHRGRPGDPVELRLRFCIAQALSESGQPEPALAELRKILQLRPGDHEARLRVGMLSLDLGRMAEAEAAARAALSGRRADYRASYILGTISLERGDHVAAAQQLRTALRGRPQDVDIRYSLARSEETAGRHASAFHEFAEIARRSRRPGWVFAAAAASALAADQAAQARGAATRGLADTKLLQKRPKLRVALHRFQLAGAAMTGGSDLAQITPPPVATIEPDRELTNYLLAGILAGRPYAAPDAAVAANKEHLAFFEAQGDEPSARYAAAFLLAAAGQTDAARKRLEALNTAQPTYLPAAVHLARLHLIDGKTELAARALRRTGEADTSSTVARTLALIDSLQGVRLSGGADDGPASAAVVGPHLAFFAVAMHHDYLACARRIVLLDPCSTTGRAILSLTYPHVRQHGLAGVGRAAEADETVDLALRRAVAAYQAQRGRLYRLAIGNFWAMLPARL